MKKPDGLNIAFWLGFLLLTAVNLTGTTTNQAAPSIQQSKTMANTIQKAPFGSTPDGKQVDLYTLTNKSGVTCKIMTYGGIVTEIDVPDRTGKMADIVLGYDSLARYLERSPYFGALVGRVANRIAKGHFT